MAESKTRWLKFGCLGCLGLLVLFILFAAVVSWMTWSSVRSNSPTEVALAPSVPSPPAPSDPTAAGEPDPADEPARAFRGRVVLDLRHGEFIVEPAPAGSGLEIEGTFDPDQYELSETLETPEGKEWVYTVGFRSRSSSLLNFARALFVDPPELRVRLPLDTPMDLDLSVREAGAAVELGGLQLRRGSFFLDKGGLDISVGEPMPEPMERLEIGGAMGGLSARKLGHASPREMDIRFAMGGLDLDLRGAWRTDARITIDTERGGGALRVPSDVHLEGLGARWSEVRGSSEVSLPTLSFSVSTRQGELEVY